jgi:hypothetical protein
MKFILIGLAAASLLGATASIAQAQDASTTTVIHKQDADGDKSKTVIKKDNGAKTVIKRHGRHVKKIHTSPSGEKTVVEKKTVN